MLDRINKLNDIGKTKRSGSDNTQWVYKTKQWGDISRIVRVRDMGRCQRCGRLIVGRYIVDHIVELTDDNIGDMDVVFGLDNLQLLCIECHNIKTAKYQKGIDEIVVNGELVLANRHELNDVNKK